MSDSKIHWELWWLRDPAACSQISDRSIDAAGRTQTRSPEPGNRAKAEQCKCHQKHLPNPHRTLTNRSSSHYRAAVIANSPPRWNANVTRKKKKEKKKSKSQVIIIEWSEHYKTLVVQQGAISTQLFVLFSAGCGWIKVPCCSSANASSWGWDTSRFPSSLAGKRGKNTFMVSS